MFKPQLKIPATYMRGGRFMHIINLVPEVDIVAAQKCDFSLLANTNVFGGQSLDHSRSA